MGIYRKGTAGNDVRRIQEALKNTGIYNGDTDGTFDDQTENAVKIFQTKKGLTPDGIVGPNTWSELFPRYSAGVQAFTGDVASRCLALTGSFETGRLAPECFAAMAGDFDGQGMSFGALQWNFGQGTLQTLLMKMFDGYPDIASKIFGPDLDALDRAVRGSREECLAFARSIQSPGTSKVIPVWKEKFRQLGLTAEFQAIETTGAVLYFEKAVRLRTDYGLWSERGTALMFDIAVQNGGISGKVRELILGDVAGLDRTLSPEELEVARMRIVANRRAEAANPKFVEDVRRRKLCIAEGRGVVHGVTYDLAAQFGIGLKQV